VPQSTVGARFWEVDYGHGQFAYMTFYGSYLVVEAESTKAAAVAEITGKLAWSCGGATWGELTVSEDRITGDPMHLGWTINYDRSGNIKSCLYAGSADWVPSQPSPTLQGGNPWNCPMFPELPGTFDTEEALAGDDSSGLGTTPSSSSDANFFNINDLMQGKNYHWALPAPLTHKSNLLYRAPPKTNALEGVYDFNLPTPMIAELYQKPDGLWYKQSSSGHVILDCKLEQESIGQDGGTWTAPNLQVVFNGPGSMTANNYPCTRT
jgi:hypothetical protein